MKRIIFISLLVSVTSFAQSNLEYFVTTALKNSPIIKEFENSKVISKLEKELVNAENVLPKISLTADYHVFPYFNNNGKYITTNPGPEAIGYDIGITNGGFYSAQFNFEKNIFNGGLIGALEEQQDLAIKSQTNSMLIEEHSIRKQVTDQYLTALQSQMNYNLAEETLQNISGQLRISAEFVEKGLAKQSDYLLLQVEEGNQKIEYSRAFVEFKNNLYSLFSLCGITDTQSTELENVSLKPEPVKDNSSFYSKYELDSLSISSQQIVFESKYLPQVTLFFNTGLNAVEIDGIQRKFGLSAGIDFSLPIYDGKQKDITRQQNFINQKIISDYKNYFSIQLQNQRISAFNQLKSIENNINMISEQLADYEIILNLKNNELNQGQISMIEYLTILKNYIDLKKSKINMEIEYKTQINNYNYWNW